MKITIFAAEVLCIVGLVYSTPSSIVSPSLLSKVTSGQRANITIVINSPVSKILSQYDGKSYSRRGQLMTTMRQSLIDFTTQTQTPVRSFLQSKGIQFRGSWITNRIFVRNAEKSLILELESNLRSSIKEIREEIVAQLDPINPVLANKPSSRAPAPGISLVGAPKLWETGNTGEGTIVSNIDSGVRGTHEILSQNFVGEYGWYDAIFGTIYPKDDTGHGSHTMGIMAGQDGFGVAPGAKWMACDACDMFCYEDYIFSCVEFTVCPHLPDGSKPDCSKAPHVSSNSWSTRDGGLDFFDDGIAVLKMAGVVPVFSAANFGPECGTVGSPGDRDVIGVAATDFNDAIAPFSSRGPSVDGKTKPDISAPGVNVSSAWFNGDEAYAYLSGTSMACPTVAGAVALLIAGNPQLDGDYDAVRAALLENAQKSGLSGDEQTCGEIPDSQFPNMVFGHGRLDIPASAGINLIN